MHGPTEAEGRGGGTMFPKELGPQYAPIAASAERASGGEWGEEGAAKPRTGSGGRAAEEAEEAAEAGALKPRTDVGALAPPLAPPLAGLPVLGASKPTTEATALRPSAVGLYEEGAPLDEPPWRLPRRLCDCSRPSEPVAPAEPEAPYEPEVGEGDMAWSEAEPSSAGAVGWRGTRIGAERAAFFALRP